MTVLLFPPRTTNPNGPDPARVFDPRLYHAGVLLTSAADLITVNDTRYPCTPPQPCPTQPAPQCVACALAAVNQVVSAPKGIAAGSLAVALAAAEAAGLRSEPAPYTILDADEVARALRTAAAHLFNEALPASISVYPPGGVN